MRESFKRMIKMVKEDTEMLDELMDGVLEDGMKQQKRHKERDDKNKWYVTSLFQCREKLKRRTEEEKAEIGTKAPVFSGNCFEDGLNRRMTKLGFVTQDDSNSDVLYMTRDVGKYTVTGRLDYYHPIKKVAIELKHPIYTKNPPKDNYICQCKTYNWMSGQENGNPDIDKMLLWQISSTGMESHLIEESFDSRDIKAYIEGPSYPFFNWECKYCDYDCDIDDVLGNVDLS